MSLGRKIVKMTEDITTTNIMLSCVELVLGSEMKGRVTLRAKGTAPCINPIKYITKYSYTFNFHFYLPIARYPIRATRYTFTILPTNRTRNVNPIKASESEDFCVESIADSKD